MGHGGDEHCGGRRDEQHLLYRPPPPPQQPALDGDGELACADCDEPLAPSCPLSVPVAGLVVPEEHAAPAERTRISAE